MEITVVPKNSPTVTWKTVSLVPPTHGGPCFHTSSTPVPFCLLNTSCHPSLVGKPSHIPVASNTTASALLHSLFSPKFSGYKVYTLCFHSPIPIYSRRNCCKSSLDSSVVISLTSPFPCDIFCYIYNCNVESQHYGSNHQNQWPLILGFAKKT